MSAFGMTDIPVDHPNSPCFFAVHTRVVSDKPKIHDMDGIFLKGPVL